MCRVYFYQATMGKSIEKIEKIHNYPSFRKIFSASRRDIGGHQKKKENLVKINPQH